MKHSQHICWSPMVTDSGKFLYHFFKNSNLSLKTGYLWNFYTENIVKFKSVYFQIISSYRYHMIMLYIRVTVAWQKRVIYVVE